MKNKYDITQFVKTVTEQSVLSGIVERVKERRKKLKLTQKDLASRSGVSYASIRRFETCGEIAFSSLLKFNHAMYSSEYSQRLKLTSAAFTEEAPSKSIHINTTNFFISIHFLFFNLIISYIAHI